MCQFSLGIDNDFIARFSFRYKFTLNKSFPVSAVCVMSIKMWFCDRCDFDVDFDWNSNAACNSAHRLYCTSLHCKNYYPKTTAKWKWCDGKTHRTETKISLKRLTGALTSLPELWYLRALNAEMLERFVIYWYCLQQLSANGDELEMSVMCASVCNEEKKHTNN